MINISREDRELAKSSHLFTPQYRGFKEVSNAGEAVEGGKLLSLPELLENYDTLDIPPDKTIYTRTMVYAANLEDGLGHIIDHTSLGNPSRDDIWLFDEITGQFYIKNEKQKNMKGFFERFSYEFGKLPRMVDHYKTNFYFAKIVDSTKDFESYNGENKDFLDSILGTELAYVQYNLFFDPKCLLIVENSDLLMSRLVVMQANGYIRTDYEEGGVAFYAD